MALCCFFTAGGISPPPPPSTPFISGENWRRVLMEALCRVIGRSICHSAPGTLAALIRSPGSLTSWMLRQNMDQMTAALLWTAAAWKGGGRGGSVCGGGGTKTKQKKRRLFCVHSPRGLLSTPVCCLSSCFPRRPLSVLRANKCSHCATLCVLLR